MMLYRKRSGKPFRRKWEVCQKMMRLADRISSCKTFSRSWHFSLCARACIPHRNPHHLSTTRLSKSIFDRVGNFEAAKVLNKLIPGVLGISTSPPLHPMPTHLLDSASKSKAVALLQAYWKPSAIAKSIYCHKSTVYRWEQNLQRYGYPNPPYPLPCGRPRAIYTAAKNAVLKYVRQHL